MKLTKILILLLAFWLEPLSASPYFSFKKYQVEDGLSHNTVWCAIQDSYGFIWLGTSDGLNRYDGRGNKVYRNVLNEIRIYGLERTPDCISMTGQRTVSPILTRLLSMAYTSAVKSRRL